MGRSMGSSPITSNSGTLRRRSNELRVAAGHQSQQDEDAAALLMFYSVECGLKAAYILKYQLRDTSDVRGSASRSAREFGHRIDQLLNELRIPASSIGLQPSAALKRGGVALPPERLHEAWRYGEKVLVTSDLYNWLSKIADWIRVNI